MYLNVIHNRLAISSSALFIRGFFATEYNFRGKELIGPKIRYVLGGGVFHISICFAITRNQISHINGINKVKLNGKVGFEQFTKNSDANGIRERGIKSTRQFNFFLWK